MSCLCAWRRSGRSCGESFASLITSTSAVCTPTATETNQTGSWSLNGSTDSHFWKMPRYREDDTPYKMNNPIVFHIAFGNSFLYWHLSIFVHNYYRHSTASAIFRIAPTITIPHLGVGIFKRNQRTCSRGMSVDFELINYTFLLTRTGRISGFR